MSPGVFPGDLHLFPSPVPPGVAPCADPDCVCAPGCLLPVHAYASACGASPGRIWCSLVLVRSASCSPTATGSPRYGSALARAARRLRSTRLPFVVRHPLPGCAFSDVSPLLRSPHPSPCLLTPSCVASGDRRILCPAPSSAPALSATSELRAPPWVIFRRSCLSPAAPDPGQPCSRSRWPRAALLHSMPPPLAATSRRAGPRQVRRGAHRPHAGATRVQGLARRARPPVHHLLAAPAVAHPRSREARDVRHRSGP